MPFPKTEIQRLFRYGIVGLATNVSLYLVFLLFLRLGLLPTMAAGLCYGLGVAMSYLLNRRWTFSSTASHRRDLPKFFLAYGIGLISTLLTITLLMIWLSPEAAQIINIGITAIVIYGSLRLVRFGQNKDNSHAY
jgi:putative flippase GtrA|tara:strand:- start:37692 stop:38096 length:405 start_codon:yes stop_codon:yes gene_type:complete